MTFISHSAINVSRETDSQLAQYDALLHKWQKAINIVSPSTLKDSEQRHFIDSLQILSHIPEGTKTLYDLGSGGGFPGMVLAIAAPQIDVTLVESDRKKCSFLATVSRETGIKTQIENKRIEETNLPAPDVITARALADLDTLLGWCLHWADKNPDLTLLFPKGRTAEDEIAAALKNYNFSYEVQPSIVSEESYVIIVHKLQKRTA